MSQRGISMRRPARRVMALLENLVRQSGATLLLVTHSRELAGRADRVLTVDSGRLTEVSASAAGAR